ncbi:hypothetical protein EDD86DRAFT_209566 [Gorgonomyces haynaldii]|nr:hypothetical protein EDD86DRAFT_209566 [Gorgonomyces haynaldii]
MMSVCCILPHDRSPPLILQAVIHDNETKRFLIPDSEKLFVKVVLSGPQMHTDHDLAEKPTVGYHSNLLGTGITQCREVLDLDEENGLGMFFIFHDLGVRCTGVYYLTCYLITVDIHADETPVSAVCRTDNFTVYAPNDFPGMVSPLIDDRNDAYYTMVPKSGH